MVHVGLKKLALSAPMAPEEMDELTDEAQRVAELNQVELYRETVSLPIYPKMTDANVAAVIERVDRVAREG